MTPEQLDEIEARANRASQAPWETSEAVDETEYGSYTAYGVEPIAPLEWFSDSDMAHVALEPMEEEDAKFIAAARTDVPNLVAEVRRLQGQIAAVRELHRDDGRGNCEVCMDFVTQGTYESAYYPCETIQALGGTYE